MDAMTNEDIFKIMDDFKNITIKNTGETLPDQVMDRFKKYIETGYMDDELYDEVYDWDNTHRKDFFSSCIGYILSIEYSNKERIYKNLKEDYLMYAN